MHGDRTWLRFIDRLTDDSASGARSRLAALATSSPADGLPMSLDSAKRDVLLLLWRLEQTPSGRPTSRRVRFTVIRHLNEIAVVINGAIEQGWVGNEVASDIAAANGVLSGARFMRSRVLLRVPKHAVDYEGLTRNAAEQSFSDRRRLAQSAASLWVAAVLAAVLVNGCAYGLLHHGRLQMALFLTFWQAQAQSLQGLRSQTLALAALAAAILALPTLNGSSALTESREKRGQQLLLQVVAEVTLGLIAVVTILSVPVKKSAVAPGVASSWPVGDWVLCIFTSVLCVVLGCGIQIAQSERIRIMSNAQRQLRLVTATLEGFPSETQDVARAGVPRRKRLSVTNPSGYATLLALNAPPVWQLARENWGLALLWIIFGFPFAAGVLYLVTIGLFLDRWDREISGHQVHRPGAASSMIILIAMLGAGYCAAPMLLRHSGTAFLMTWAGCLAAFLLHPRFYARIRPDQVQLLHAVHLERTRKLLEETIRLQKMYLAAAR